VATDESLVEKIGRLDQAIQENLRARNDLLQHVRRLRFEIHGIERDNALLDRRMQALANASVVDSQDTTNPRSASSDDPRPHGTAAVEAQTAHADASPQTGRNYDYFVDLDKKLAILESELVEPLDGRNLDTIDLGP